MPPSFPASQREFLRRLVSCAVMVEPDTKDGYGSGFVLSLDGYVLTALHVLGEATRGEIRCLRLLNDWRVEPGGPKRVTLVTADPALDLALLKLDRLPPRLAAVTLGVSATIRPGTALWRVGVDVVPLASGYCFHVQHRLFDQDDFRVGLQAGPGSSGGPLYDSDGLVVGIAQKCQPDEKRPPFSVALPIDTVVKKFLEKYALRVQLETNQTINLFSTSFV